MSTPFPNPHILRSIRVDAITVKIDMGTPLLTADVSLCTTLPDIAGEVPAASLAWVHWSEDSLQAAQQLLQEVQYDLMEKLGLEGLESEEGDVGSPVTIHGMTLVFGQKTPVLEARAEMPPPNSIPGHPGRLSVLWSNLEDDGVDLAVALRHAVEDHVSFIFGAAASTGSDVDEPLPDAWQERMESEPSSGDPDDSGFTFNLG